MNANRSGKALSHVLLAVAALSTGGAPGRAIETDPPFWSAGERTLRAAPEASPAASSSASATVTGSARQRTSQRFILSGNGSGASKAADTPGIAVELPAGVAVEDLFVLGSRTFLSAIGESSETAVDRGPHPDLFLALIDADGAHRLPVPAVATASASFERANAVPMVKADGDLAGLVWLEGADRQSFTVQYAAWTGFAWGEPVEVAAPAAGSQLALSVAGLADGTSVAIWSRFDGQDDEIVAARFDGRNWSSPEPIAADNAVPDITPSIVAVPGGAVAVWSRYDGHEYRSMVARFDGTRWGSPAWAGPAGATDPSLSRVANRTWITFAGASPHGWGVLELDAEARVVAQARTTTALQHRPALTALGSRKVRLDWAASESTLDLQP
ncbi:MAG: hypothetical protein ABI639_15825 [Thermoanaerobaculia bacterium]